MSKYIRVNGKLYKAVDSLSNDYVKVVNTLRSLEKQYHSKFIDRIILQASPSHTDIETAKKWAKSVENFLKKNSKTIHEDKIDTYTIEYNAREIRQRLK